MRQALNSEQIEWAYFFLRIFCPDFFVPFFLRTDTTSSKPCSNPLAFPSRFSAVATEPNKNFISDRFPGITEKIIEIPAKRLGFPQIRSVPGKDAAQCVLHGIAVTLAGAS